MTNTSTYNIPLQNTNTFNKDSCNLALKCLDFLRHKCVFSVITSLPTSPLDDGFYLVGNSATGSLTGQAGKIAIVITPLVYQLINARVGDIIKNVSNNEYYQFTTSTTYIKLIPSYLKEHNLTGSSISLPLTTEVVIKSATNATTINISNQDCNGTSFIANTTAFSHSLTTSTGSIVLAPNSKKTVQLNNGDLYA
jgi:hypothetical protein